MNEWGNSWNSSGWKFLLPLSPLHQDFTDIWLCSSSVSNLQCNPVPFSIVFNILSMVYKIFHDLIPGLHNSVSPTTTLSDSQELSASPWLFFLTAVCLARWIFFPPPLRINWFLFIFLIPLITPLECLKVTQSYMTLPPHGLYSPWNSPGQNTGVGSLSLLQGIFPTQGSNPGLPQCRWILY